ncbi:MAG: pyridoxamine 5'-phosphate oxidase family protein [Acidimicrobiia bacterium]
MGILPDAGRAAERLDGEAVAWLTTVTASGQPQSSVVWFVVHDDVIYIQSQPTATKWTNVRANSMVSFHLNSDANGGDIVTVDADAEILDAFPPGVQDAYLAKYARRVREELQSTPDAILADYSTTIRITPRRIRVW